MRYNAGDGGGSGDRTVVVSVSQAMAPHVVVVLNTASGHAIPFLRFSRHLAAAGIVTTVVSSDRHVRELEKLLGSADLTAQGEPLRLLGLRDGKAHLSHEECFRGVLDNREQTEAVIALLQAVVADVSSPQSLELRGVPPAAPPASILHDMFLPWAQEAAENLHIESHLLYVSGATALAVEMQGKRFLQEGRLPITKDTRDMVISGIPGLPLFNALDLPCTYVNATSDHWIWKCSPRYGRADVILVNTFYDVEKPVLDALRAEVIGSPGIKTKKIWEVGPLLPASYVNDDTLKDDPHETDPCMLWLSKQPPNSVLYVSFGSSATHSVLQLRELAEGLDASGSSFLWLVRPPNSPGISAASGAPLSVSEFLPPGFEERVRGRGMIYSGWAPQPRILKHPAVGGFLSHCGWNSTLEAVSAGVPILAWPVSAEQHLNRRVLVTEVKAALELQGNPYTKEQLEGDDARPKLFISKEEIERKARSLMQGEEGQAVRNVMHALRIQSRDAGAPGGASRRNFEAYVKLLHDMQTTQ